MNVFIVHAHPEKRSLNGALTDFAVAALGELAHTVEISDLYAMGWRGEADGRDFPTRPADEVLRYAAASKQAFAAGTQADEIAEEQRKLLWADAVILQFPLWWFAMPAILKGWVDRVFACGFAYGVPRPGGRWGERYGAGKLAGKRALVSVTTGAPAPQYSTRGIHGAIDDLLFPITHGTLYYPGMAVLPSFVVYDAARLRGDGFAAVAESYRSRLETLFTAEPIAYRAQDGGDYDDELCLKPSLEGEARGFAIHCKTR
jgi:NAD(P)H dehydrogenase (quinone)